VQINWANSLRIFGQNMEITDIVGTQRAHWRLLLLIFGGFYDTVDERCKFLSGSSMKDFVKFVKFVVCLNRVLPNFAVEPNNNQTDALQGRLLFFTEFI
jgi:hypothetical protein